MAWYWIVLIVFAYLMMWTLMAAWAYSTSDEDEELFVGILIVSMLWPIVLVIVFIGNIVRKITKQNKL